jgi:hypothetical protein
VIHLRFKWGRLAAMAVTLAAATSLAGPAMADAVNSAQPTSVKAYGSGCTFFQREQSLAFEQRRVLNLLKGFYVLWNMADLDRLSQLNPVTGTQFAQLPHMFNSMLGVGFTITNDGNQGPGLPTLLFYRPNPQDLDVTQPYVPDFPYTLAGWAYVSPYTPGVAPAWPDDPGLRCITPSDSFVHERSVHPADTWQNTAFPPAEQYLGQVAANDPPTAAECGCVIGLAHGRFWDTHIWLTGGPVPQVSMYNPGPPIPGFNPITGVGFFYPAVPPVSATSAPDTAMPGMVVPKCDLIPIRQNCSLTRR